MPNIGEALQRKVGPLPAFAWLAVIGGGIFVARRMGSAKDAEEVPEDEFAGGESVDFPSNTLRPITGEHAAEELPPTWWPTPSNPLPVTPVPPTPLPGGSEPPPGVPSFYWMGRRWLATERGAFQKYIQQKRPLGYRSLREWIYGVKPTKKDRRRLAGHLPTARKMGWV